MFTLRSSTSSCTSALICRSACQQQVGRPVCLFRDLDSDLTKGAQSWGGVFLSGHSTSLKGYVLGRADKRSAAVETSELTSR